MIFICKEKEEQFIKINKQIQTISNSFDKLDKEWEIKLKLHSINILVVELQKMLEDG